MCLWCLGWLCVLVRVFVVVWCLVFGWLVSVYILVEDVLCCVLGFLCECLLWFGFSLWLWWLCCF